MSHKTADFPTTIPVQPTLVGPSDAFIAKLNSAWSALIYSTYFGGSADEGAFGIAVDTAGNVYDRHRNGAAFNPLI
jgi:hypothetical protein